MSELNVMVLFYLRETMTLQRTGIRKPPLTSALFMLLLHPLLLQPVKFVVSMGKAVQVNGQNTAILGIDVTVTELLNQLSKVQLPGDGSAFSY